MDTNRKLAIAFGVSRIAYGVALLVAPGRVGSPWLGGATAAGGGRVAARALAVRDGALGAGAIGAILSGGPARPWFAACAVSDVVDLTATFADRDGLPDHSPPATAAVAGGMALAGAALFASVES